MARGKFLTVVIESVFVWWERVKYLAQCSLKAWLCEESVVHWRFLCYALFLCYLNRNAQLTFILIHFNLCFSKPESFVFVAQFPFVWSQGCGSDAEAEQVFKMESTQPPTQQNKGFVPAPLLRRKRGQEESGRGCDGPLNRYCKYVGYCTERVHPLILTHLSAAAEGLFPVYLASVPWLKIFLSIHMNRNLTLP